MMARSRPDMISKRMLERGTRMGRRGVGVIQAEPQRSIGDAVIAWEFDDCVGRKRPQGRERKDSHTWLVQESPMTEHTK